MNENIIPVSINILDKEYRIACTKEEREDLLVSSKYLDSKMRELKDGGKIVGPDKIAVVAALNIAHELIQLRVQHVQLGEKLDTLGNRIDQALGSQYQLLDSQ